MGVPACKYGRVMACGSHIIWLAASGTALSSSWVSVLVRSILVEATGDPMKLLHTFCLRICTAGANRDATYPRADRTSHKNASPDRDQLAATNSYACAGDAPRWQPDCAGHSDVLAS